MVTNRPSLQNLSLDAGRTRHLHHMLYDRGPANGTLMILPIDQGLEHGPIDFLPNPDAQHPLYQFELAVQGGFSAIATHIGLAQKYYPGYAGKIPLILKLNGKTSIPPDDEAFSACTGTVHDAVKLGADAVGYTLFVGSPRQDEDIAQLREVRRQAHEHGLPLIVWAYPRGKYIDAKGGKESLYAVAYAARVAHEMGADVIKVNFPAGVNRYCPEAYRDLKLSFDQEVASVVRAAGHSLVIFSGGSKADQQELLGRVDTGMQQGGAGVIFGRNLWQRPFDEGLHLAQQIRSILSRYSA